MPKPIEISASILAADFANLAAEVKRSEAAGVDRFHVDCMDGHFVPNLTIGPVIVQAVRKHTKLPIEAHLMIEHPGKYIEAYAKAGADIIQVQVECYGQRRANCRQWDQWPKEIDSVDVPALRADLKRIKALGKKAHIVINPGTPLVKDVLDDCDGVLVMSVNPGYAGQKFMPAVLSKVKELAAIFKGDIAIDGGIDAQTAPEAVAAGARVLITASYFYGAPDPAVAAGHLKKLSTRGQTAMEYLLLFGLVAFVVFLAFSPNGFMTKVHDASSGYFDKVSNVIMGENPQPIPGGWCAWSGCDKDHRQYRTCECPAPAFCATPDCAAEKCSGSSQQGC